LALDYRGNAYDKLVTVLGNSEQLRKQLEVFVFDGLLMLLLLLMELLVHVENCHVFLYALKDAALLPNQVQFVLRYLCVLPVRRRLVVGLLEVSCEEFVQPFFYLPDFFQLFLFET